MKTIELFAGAGGLGMGVSKAGFTPLQIVEWNKWCCDTILENRRRKVPPISNWPEPWHGDIRNASFSQFEGKLDLVTGGPPCQPFSMGGKHKAHTDSRDMWSEAVRAVREAKPKAFMFENVKGLTRASFSSYLSYIELQLNHPELVKKTDEAWHDHLTRLEQHHTYGRYHGLKYNVIWEVVNAANFGVPQKRERIVFVGFRDDLGAAWSFPKPTHSIDAMLWDQYRSGKYWDRHRVPVKHQNIDHRLHKKAMKMSEKPKEKAWRTVRDALCGLPSPSLDPSPTILNHRLQPGARSYPGHTGSPLDEPAKTLKAGVHGVPGGENMLALPDGTVRYFTVRESARLQSFPDQFALQGSWSEAMRQLGNAVPVDLAKVIGDTVFRELKRVA